MVITRAHYLESIPGKLVKLGEGHYRLVFDDRYSNTGRKPGRKKPVPKSKQVVGKNYCDLCDRPLNSNNTLGVCRECGQLSKRELAECMRNR